MITAVVVEQRAVAEVAATYGVSRSWLYELLARYRAEGEGAFEPRSKRPHHSLPHQATPAPAYRARPKAAPGADPASDSHDRVRADTVDRDGKLTLRVNGRLHHIGIGRTHARTPVLMLIQDLDVRVIDAATGELLRELTIDPTRDYQPTGNDRYPRRRQPPQKPEKTDP